MGDSIWSGQDTMISTDQYLLVEALQEEEWIKEMSHREFRNGWNCAEARSRATVPRSAFGKSGEGHLRISFGCLSDEDLEPAMKLLSEVSFPE